MASQNMAITYMMLHAEAFAQHVMLMCSLVMQRPSPWSAWFMQPIFTALASTHLLRGCVKSVERHSK